MTAGDGVGAGRDVPAGWRPAAEEPQAWLDRALDNLVTAHPHHPMHVVLGPGEAGSHAERHPAFWGAYDWHSSVHMHWLVVHLLRSHPDLARADEARRLLRDRLTPAHLEAECGYLERHATFERPYGWAWLVRLHAELATWDDPVATVAAAALAPARDLLVRRFTDWLPRLAQPVRHGAHPNTAFALLLLDWSGELTGDGGVRDLAARHAERLFGGDRDAPTHWEPSGEDFLSPILTEAHLLSRVRPGEAFLRWLDAFLPGLADGDVGDLTEPPVVLDPADYRIGHLVGLGFTRAWSWRALAAALPTAHPGRAVALRAAADHLAAARSLVGVTGFGGDHWLATYAALATGPDLAVTEG